MDASGNNRYELLFMDDDGSTPGVSAVETVAEKPKPKSVVTPGASQSKKAQAVKKPNLNAEKENKSASMNKNDLGKKVNNVPGYKERQVSAGGAIKARPNGSIDHDGVRSGSFRQQQNENGEQRPPRRNFREGGFLNAGGQDNNNENQRPPRQFRDRDNRGPARNRNGESGFRNGKREFDRQSGSDKTGVKSIDKRDGAGAHNWGSVKQDIDDINKPTPESDAVLTDKEESTNDQSIEQVPQPEEEETKEFTLDEWKAMRQIRNKPEFNIRKAGEGEDTSQWKKMVVLNKKKEFDSEEEFEFDPSMYPQRVGRLQRIVDIQFNFNDGRRGGGFGGFGRGRGRGGPGGIRPGGDRNRFDVGRGDAPGDAARSNLGKPRNFNDRPRGGLGALKVDDERQFPTLS